MDDSPVHLFISLCGFNYLWCSAKPGCGSFGPGGSIWVTDRTPLCPCVPCASWQCKIQQHGREITSHRLAKGGLGPHGRMQGVPGTSQMLCKGGLFLRMIKLNLRLSPSALNVFFKGNRLKTSPAGLACQREREERGRLLPQKGSESAGHWFPSNTNYCLLALEIV